MEQTVKDRLQAYLAANRISQSEFCRTLGVSTSYITAMRKGIPAGRIKAIREAYPDLNTEWLIYGEGEMTISGDNNNSQIGQNNYNSSGVLEKAIDEIAEQRKLTAESQSQVSRLLSIIENLQKAQN